MNQLGITHMAFIVDDLAETAERIASLGGTVLRHTHVAGPMGDMMFATDPDGTRLELWEKKNPA
jgi:predicted enzyme related to lactoylglutathione lyase